MKEEEEIKPYFSPIMMNAGGLKKLMHDVKLFYKDPESINLYALENEILNSTATHQMTQAVNEGDMRIGTHIEVERWESIDGNVYTIDFEPEDFFWQLDEV